MSAITKKESPTQPTPPPLVKSAALHLFIPRGGWTTRDDPRPCSVLLQEDTGDPSYTTFLRILELSGFKTAELKAAGSRVYLGIARKEYNSLMAMFKMANQVTEGHSAIWYNAPNCYIDSSGKQRIDLSVLGLTSTAYNELLSGLSAIGIRVSSGYKDEYLTLSIEREEDVERFFLSLEIAGLHLLKSFAEDTLIVDQEKHGFTIRRQSSFCPTPVQLAAINTALGTAFLGAARATTPLTNSLLSLSFRQVSSFNGFTELATMLLGRPCNLLHLLNNKGLHPPLVSNR